MGQAFQFARCPAGWKACPTTNQQNKSLVCAQALTTNRQGLTDNYQEVRSNSQEPRAKSQEPSLRLNRPQLLWFVEAWLHGNFASRNQGNQTGMALFPTSGAVFTVPPLPDLTLERKWQQEIETLGLVLSVHPLTMWQPVIRTLPYRLVPASKLAQHVGKQVWVLGWPITRKEVLTREGESMEFVSFEDTTAIYETVFFPRAYRKFCQEVDMHRAYLLYGQVGSEFGAVSLQVQQLLRLMPAAADERRRAAGAGGR